MAELPGVGENLIDHPQCLTVYRASRPDSLFGAFNPENLAQFAEGRGPLTSNGLEAGGFIRTRDGLDAPDVQLYCSVGMWLDEGYRARTRRTGSRSARASPGRSAGGPSG